MSSRAWTDEEARKFTAPCVDRWQWNAWLAAHDTRVARTAWSEGAHTMTTGTDNDWIEEQNPYRDPEETP